VSAYLPLVEPFIAYPLWIVFTIGYTSLLSETVLVTIGIGLLLLFPLAEALWAAFARGVRYGSLLMIALDVAGGYYLYTSVPPVEAVSVLAPGSTGVLSGVTGGALLLASLHLPLLWVAFRR
jgi:hypothetical protein